MSKIESQTSQTSLKIIFGIILTFSDMFNDVCRHLTAIASTFMVKNGQKMRFLGPKMTLFAVQNGPKQPKNPLMMHKTSGHIIFGLIGTLFAHLFAFNRT